MTRSIPGIHHVTAISGPPQPNVDFYTGPLGQRLVKKTVNFDAPDTYHLYYGDRTGSPGTIMTFFPFADAGPGRPGPGMAAAHAYAVPSGGLEAWMARLGDDAIDFDLGERFGQRLLTLRDPDGAAVELVETAGAAGGEALDGFHSVTLWERDPEPTARVLTEIFGYLPQGEEREGATTRLRFVAPGGARGSIVDVIRVEGTHLARPGAGTIHHVAFRAESDAVQLEWREKVLAAGHRVTPPIDRNYFNAIYFREPGGVLFEIATDPPGFAVDEPEDRLGEALKLPPQYEARRAQIERILPPVRPRA
ncbi:MAG: ring-cleaving dioxygenase [Rhodobacteraceae bacterium]|nr:ring-cleaving dioxygenase [Paracoccaceae bacterium]